MNNDQRIDMMVEASNLGSSGQLLDTEQPQQQPRESHSKGSLHESGFFRSDEYSVGEFSMGSAGAGSRLSGSGAFGGGDPTRPSKDQESHEKQRELVKNMAARETTKVNIWRRNVFIVIALTAAAVTALTYIFLAREDHENFESAFREFAQTIEESTEFNLRGLIEGTNGLSQVLTSEAINTNSTWPFMTLSSFEVYVRNTRAQGASELVVFTPFVQPDQIEQWNDYSNEYQGWIDQSFLEYDTGRLDLNPIPSSIYRFGRFKGRTVLKPEDGLHTPYPTAPFWQMSRPPFDTSIVNFNALSEESYQRSYEAMNISRHWVMGIAGPNTLIDYTISAEEHDQLHSASEIDANNSQAGFANDHPHTQLIYPVFQSKNPSHPSGSDIYSPIVAMIVNILPWDNYLKRLLPPGVDGIYCILHNSAGQSFTYIVRGPTALYLGEGDLHDSRYDEMEYRINFDDFLDTTTVEIDETDLPRYNYNALSYWFSVYPSQEFESDYDTKTPLILAIVVALSFSFMTITFILYDRFVVRKNKKILDAATHSNAILASLFPKNVKERLLEEKANEIQQLEEQKKIAMQASSRQHRGSTFIRGTTTQTGLQNFLDHGGGTSMSNIHAEDEPEILDSDPIADLFPEATVLFADLVGFTAWSSTREPTQVFILLETLYRNFDIIAKRRRVYKVETIGDCYVAVTGCPTPRKNHHVVMVRFCLECLNKMKQLTRKLESKLGPDTSTLNMRFGLHSGSVTGGVLRGERSRFQLFGDTMNTAARMESNGKPGKVHMSEATANLLRQWGKGHWLEMREDKVQAKGKGEMQTYWLGRITSIARSSTTDSSESAFSEAETSHFVDGENRVSLGGALGLDELVLDEKTHRVVEWTTQTLMTLLEKLEASRSGSVSSGGEDVFPKLNQQNKSMPLDELQEVIALPEYDRDLQTEQEILLGQDIEDQLEFFVGMIASKYPEVETTPFHNFFHASHVCMTLLKLFKTIGIKNSQTEDSADADALGRRIASDPLTIFACAFAALIHDAQHPGVPNFIFKYENTHMAGMYAGRCVAEQNSFDVAWNILSEDRFKELRAKIARNEEEAIRFRQLVINTVIATDLFDGELVDQRNEGWEKAFFPEESDQPEQAPEQVLNRKATVVIGHMIQAADMSHTMLHWEIYRKWNTKLFQEMYKAFHEGRSKKDPSETWYQGELTFFDNHVIPLAERLVSCKCFGVTAEEFLSNAKQNRTEWEQVGHSLVPAMLEEAKAECGLSEERGMGEELPQSLPSSDMQLTSDFKLLSIEEAEQESQSELFLKDESGRLGDESDKHEVFLDEDDMQEVEYKDSSNKNLEDAEVQSHSSASC